MKENLPENPTPLWKKITDSFFFHVFLIVLLKSFVFGWYCVPTGCLEPTLLVGDRILANKTAYWFAPVKRGDLVIFDNPEITYSKKPLLYLWQRFIGIPIKQLGLPAGPDAWVKRVIAIPGDTLEGRIEDGKAVLYRNGERLDEPYVNPYPLIAVQKMNGFFSPRNPIIKALPSFLTRIFVKRKSDNCEGDPSWYTFNPEVPFDEQPYYKIEPQEIVRNRYTGEPFIRQAGKPERYDSFMKFTVPENHYWCQGDSRRNSKDSRSWGFLDGSRVRGKASMIVYSINSEEVSWFFDILKNPIDFWTKKLRSERSFSALKNPLPESQQS